MHYVESLEFVAEDDTAFAQWTSVLASAIRYKIYALQYNRCSALQDSDNLDVKIRYACDY